MPKVYELPGYSAGPGMTYVQTFLGPGTPFNGGAGTHIVSGFPDGTSNTILIAAAKNPVNWMAPFSRLNPRNPAAALGTHYRNSFLVGLADGTVRFVSLKVSDATLRNAINPSDGNPLGPDWDR
jgi:hypothetical protein